MSESNSQFALLKTRRFLPFFITQLLGAFNDNVFKNALIVMIAYQATLHAGEGDMLISLCAALFILPFFLFSATAGQLADVMEKARLMRMIKFAEIIIMALACVALYFEQVTALIAILFLMGTQSSFFGPVKYSVLPQHLANHELIGGNGLVEMGTFMAILLGTLTGGLLIGTAQGAIWVGLVLMLVATLGWLASRSIPAAPATAADKSFNWNPVSETWHTLKITYHKRNVWLAVLGISWFWALGSVYLTQLPSYSKTVLHGNEQLPAVLLALFSVGIGAGSLLCERLSGHKIELGLVPFGAIGLSLFGIDLYFTPLLSAPAELWTPLQFIQQPGALGVVIDLVGIGVFGGFYIVPLYALVQSQTKPEFRSRVIAGNNILNALLMVIAALLSGVFLAFDLSIPQLFLTIALLNIAVAVYIFTLAPVYMMRFLVWLVTHTLYRVRHQDLTHIPRKGPAVIVANHVSYLDGLILAGACRRPIRFVMDHRIYRIPILHFIFKTGRAIAIAPAKEDPNCLRHAYDKIADALAQGDLVCIFPEGGITYSGELMPFKNGVERIIKRTPVPVIPVAIQGLWGSFFSRKGGRKMRCIPGKIWGRVNLIAGEALPAEQISATALQHRVQQLLDKSV